MCKNNLTSDEFKNNDKFNGEEIMLKKNKLKCLNDFYINIWITLIVQVDKCD